MGPPGQQQRLLNVHALNAPITGSNEHSHLSGRQADTNDLAAKPQQSSGHPWTSGQDCVCAASATLLLLLLLQQQGQAWD